MLIFLIEDVTNDELVYLDAIKLYVHEEIVLFKWGIIGLTIGLILYVLICILSFI